MRASTYCLFLLLLLVLLIILLLLNLQRQSPRSLFETINIKRQAGATTFTYILHRSPGLLCKLLGVFCIISDKEVVKDGAGLHLHTIKLSL